MKSQGVRDLIQLWEIIINLYRSESGSNSNAPTLRLVWASDQMSVSVPVVWSDDMDPEGQTVSPKEALLEAIPKLLGNVKTNKENFNIKKDCRLYYRVANAHKAYIDVMLSKKKNKKKIQTHRDNCDFYFF